MRIRERYIYIFTNVFYTKNKNTGEHEDEREQRSKVYNINTYNFIPVA